MKCKYSKIWVVSNAEETTLEIEETGLSEVCSTSEVNIVNDNAFVQLSADNVDHNIITLTGKGTFHDMRIMSHNG